MKNCDSYKWESVIVTDEKVHQIMKTMIKMMIIIVMIMIIILIIRTRTKSRALVLYYSMLQQFAFYNGEFAT